MAHQFGEATTPRTASVRFAVEARTVVGACSIPAWDTLFLSGDHCEVVEVKSGQLSRKDRLALWKRLRRELNPAPSIRIIPSLVLDPDSGVNTTMWQELPQKALAAASSKHFQIPPSCPNSVANVDELLHEAVWCLCDATGIIDDSPALTVVGALELISNFKLELHVFSELEASVSDSIEMLFPDGMSDQICSLILGWLNRRAASNQTERHYFTLKELLGEMDVAQHSAALTAVAHTENDVEVLVHVRKRASTPKDLKISAEFFTPASKKHQNCDWRHTLVFEPPR